MISILLQPLKVLLPAILSLKYLQLNACISRYLVPVTRALFFVVVILRDKLNPNKVQMYPRFCNLRQIFVSALRGASQILSVKSSTPFTHGHDGSCLLIKPEQRSRNTCHHWVMAPVYCYTHKVNVAGVNPRCCQDAREPPFYCFGFLLLSRSRYSYLPQCP